MKLLTVFTEVQECKEIGDCCSTNLSVGIADHVRVSIVLIQAKSLPTVLNRPIKPSINKKELTYYTFQKTKYADVYGNLFWLWKRIQ